MTPKVIIFDAGGVFIHINTSPKIKDFLSKCSYPEKNLKFMRSSSGSDFDAGKITSEDFYKRVVSVLGYTGNFSEFINDYCSLLWPDNQMFDFLKSLRANNPRLDFWLLSNVSISHWHYILGTWPHFIVPFSKLFLSFEMQCVKPYGNIYKKMYRIGNENPQNTVFIDDQPINGLFPKKLGAKFIHFENQNQLSLELQSLGIVV